MGWATALTLGKAGCKVAIAARDANRLRECEVYWREQDCPGQLYTCTTDLSDQAGVLHWADQLTTDFPQLDVLINNLGAFAPGELLQGPAGQLEQFLRTNVLSSHYLTRVCLPLMQQANHALLVTIGSVATLDEPAAMAAYTLSKQAQESWHRLVARELEGTSVGCLLVRPGATYTHSWAGIDVDPATLLSAQQVADWVFRVLTDWPVVHVDTITLRPGTIET